LSDYTPGAFERNPVLLVGYAQVAEAAMAAGVHELAAAIAAAREACTTMGLSSAARDARAL
jgi:hypothetical protein